METRRETLHFSRPARKQPPFQNNQHNHPLTTNASATHQHGRKEVFLQIELLTGIPLLTDGKRAFSSAAAFNIGSQNLPNCARHRDTSDPY